MEPIYVMVLPKGGDWEVRVGETSIEYELKEHALIAGRAIAIVLDAELQPHDEQGRIQDPDSFGHDPRESKG